MKNNFIDFSDAMLKIQLNNHEKPFQSKAFLWKKDGDVTGSNDCLSRKRKLFGNKDFSPDRT